MRRANPPGSAASQGLAGAPAILSFIGSLKVFVALAPCDMRKGFEGLAGERLRAEVKSGALFVFGNKRHTRLKVLYFDGTRLWLMTMRLIYNLAFVLPLIVIFVLAYYGLRSESLVAFQKKHTALVRLATALLFLTLFATLLPSSRIG